MSFIICPVCNKEHIHNPKQCTCGFEGLSLYENNDSYRNKQWFNLYKFTKRVYTHQIPFAVSDLDLITENDCIYVDFVNTKMGLSIVDINTDWLTIATNGMLAFNRKTKALILNVHQIEEDILDESSVHVLFLGQKVHSFTNDCLKQKSFLRYLFVDENNESFISDNHVLFNKTKTKLFVYASLKDETEYYVDKSVKYIQKYAFYYPVHLKTLYLPKGIILEKDSILGDVNIIYYD